MRSPKISLRLLPALALAGLLSAFPSRARAQAVALPAGVEINAKGILDLKLFPDPDGSLTRQCREIGRAKLNPKIAALSKLRMVSLNRLEAAINERLAKGLKPTDEMLYLAGLTRVQYVFCLPDSHDIILAGPAEGWAPDLSGRICGISTGRPVVELQDLIVALRAFPPGGKATPDIRCSIDPTQEGLASEQQFINTHRPSAPTQDQADSFATGLAAALGLQTVTIDGVAATSHFAQVLVEADYRMKLIGIGKEEMPRGIKMKSWAERANPNSIARNQMDRWWFVPNYDCLKVGSDDLSMELVGDGVKLVGADEVVMANGERREVKGVDRASKAFTDDFSKKYSQIAAAIPVYAQLRNLIDLSVVAAFIQEKDLATKADWNMTTFRDERALPVETMSAPRQVATAVNVVWKGPNRFCTPIGGGVHIEPKQALASPLSDKENKIGQAREKVDLKSLAKGQWWWE